MTTKAADQLECPAAGPEARVDDLFIHTRR